MTDYTGSFIIAETINDISRELHKKTTNIKFQQFTEALKAHGISIFLHGVDGLSASRNVIKAKHKNQQSWVYFTESEAGWWNLSPNVIKKVMAEIQKHSPSDSLHIIIQGRSDDAQEWYYGSNELVKEEKRIILTGETIGNYAVRTSMEDIINKLKEKVSNNGADK